MSRVLALIGNHPEVCGSIARRYASVLTTRGAKQPAGWGVGFYQGGQPLLRRRPVDDREVLEVQALQEAVGALILAQVRSPTVGALRTENTPPFRHKRWLFSMRGSLANAEDARLRVVEALPAYLRGNVRGTTDSEAVFYSFLASLEQILGQDRQQASLGDVGAALRHTLIQMDELGNGPADVDCFAANGELLAAAHRTGLAGYRWLNDVDELSRGLPQKLGAARLPALQCCVVVAGVEELPEGFEELPQGKVLLCSRTEPPVVDSL